MRTPKLFGTDGVRGRYGEKITEALAFSLAKSWAKVCSLSGETILIAEDTRESSSSLAKAFSEGLKESGVHASMLGVVPTPALAFSCLHFSNFGVVISASHNPFFDNGLKFFTKNGVKLSSLQEESIEALMFEASFEKSPLKGKDKPIPPWKEAYQEHLQKALPSKNALRGLKVLLDCANGSFSELAPEFLQHMGVELTTIANAPDGRNINDGVGSTHMDALHKHINPSYHIALSFDGDGDRVLAASAKKELIDGDDFLFLLYQNLKHLGRKPKALVGTLMSNEGLNTFLKKENTSLIRTPVGDKYVIEELISKNLPLGGENSGHIIPRYIPGTTTGDALLSSILLLSFLKEKQCSVDELLAPYQRFSQYLINVPTKDFSQEKLKDPQAKLQEELDSQGGGRILIRKSGTEPLVRVMVESKDKHLAQRGAKMLASWIDDKQEN